MVARSSGETARAVASSAASWLAWPSGSIAAMRTAPASSDSVHHDQLLQRSLVPNGEDFLQLRCAGDKNNARPRIAQDISGLFGCERGIDRHRDRPQQQGSEVRNRPLRPVLAQNGNPVTATDAPLLQRRPPPLRPGWRSASEEIATPLLPQLLQHHPGMLALDHRKETHR